MAFTFKIKLEGSTKPPIWRSLKMDGAHTFLDLHLAIQGVFNWENTHLFQFSPTGWGSTPRLSENFKDDDWDHEVPFSKPNTWPFGERYDAAAIKLEDFFHTPKQKMVYIYDFGDDWKHSVTLTEITAEKLLAPQCLGGKGKAPVDDCGGIWGYYEMVEAINDPKHREHKDFCVWLGLKKGQRWELDAFNLEEVRDRLREVWEEEKGK
ncbi:MAG: plasmid pRiA4b ORF-3 family protein [Flavobacteriaceae bacterium]